MRSRVSACKQFLLMEVECRVIAAAMEELHIQDINDIPVDDYMPSNLTTKKEKRNFVEKLAVSVGDKYILQCDKVELFLQKNWSSTDSGSS